MYLLAICSVTVKIYKVETKNSAVVSSVIIHYLILIISSLFAMLIKINVHTKVLVFCQRPQCCILPGT